MKKLLFICLVLISTQSFSQGLMSRLNFGLKAGSNYSNYTNANFATDGLFGFHAGALVNFRITDNFSIQQEFLFSSQGAKIKGDVFAKENVNISYFTVPFLLKYRTNFGLYIEGGAQVGALIHDDLKNTTVDNFAKKLDLDGVGGIGYQTKGGFGVGVRYIAGLSKVADFNISNVQSDFKTSVIQASIFYIF